MLLLNKQASSLPQGRFFVGKKEVINTERSEVKQTPRDINYIRQEARRTQVGVVIGPDSPLKGALAGSLSDVVATGGRVIVDFAGNVTVRIG